MILSRIITRSAILFAIIEWVVSKRSTDDACVQAKNIILNVSEMEAKVLEATNDEPWYVFLATFRDAKIILTHSLIRCRGASSTLMNEISQGTFNLCVASSLDPFLPSRSRRFGN
jgi:hypothetical protein